MARASPRSFGFTQGAASCLCRQDHHILVCLQEPPTIKCGMAPKGMCGPVHTSLHSARATASCPQHGPHVAHEGGAGRWGRRLRPTHLVIDIATVIVVVVVLGIPPPRWGRHPLPEPHANRRENRRKRAATPRLAAAGGGREGCACHLARTSVCAQLDPHHQNPCILLFFFVLPAPPLQATPTGVRVTEAPGRAAKQGEPGGRLPAGPRSPHFKKRSASQFARLLSCLAYEPPPPTAGAGLCAADGAGSQRGSVPAATGVDEQWATHLPPPHHPPAPPSTTNCSTLHPKVHDFLSLPLQPPHHHHHHPAHRKRSDGLPPPCPHGNPHPTNPRHPDQPAPPAHATPRYAGHTKTEQCNTPADNSDPDVKQEFRLL